MKSIEFSEDMLENLDEVAKQLFESTDDPTSRYYIRKLNRPKIPWLKVIMCLIGVAVLLFASTYTAYSLGGSAVVCTVAFFSVAFLLAVLLAKNTAVCMIKIYQYFAPASIRSKCRFEPSCSQYMLLAIEKYGLIKGIKKGVNRLKRCNINNGGYDFP